MNAPASNRRKALYLGTALASTLLAPGLTAVPAKADPTPNATPVFSANGGADIHADPAPGASGVIVDLQDDNRIITWSSFKVGKNSTVDFITADTSKTYAALNRVLASGGGTEIYGALTSTNGGANNIDVYLIDTAGITFGPTGTYNGGSLSVSTIDLTDADFLDNYDADPAAGQSLNYSGTGTGIISVRNGATISPTGNLILAAPQIDVSGKIDATGQVGLVAAKNVTFASGLGSPLSFTIAAGTPLTGVTVASTGDIKGGSIALVGVSETTAVSALLNVNSGAKLTATANNGAIILATADTGSISVPENGDGIAFNGSLLSAAGKTGVTATIASAAAVTGAGTINVSGAGAISGSTVNLTGNITTGGGLDVDATGDATLSGTISTGGLTTVDAIGTVNVKNLTASAGNVALTGGAITLDGASLTAQAGSLTLTGPATATDTTSTLKGTSITLGAVDGDAAGHGNLVLNSSGTTTLGGAIGASNALKSLTTNAGGTTAINGGTVTTSGAQSYGDDVTLGADATLASTGDQDITFAGTINGAYALTVNTGGVTEFKGAVGNSAPLTTLTTDLDGAAGEKTRLAIAGGGTIKTSGAQTYNDPLELGADAKLQITPGPGALTIASVDGTHTLSVDVPGLASIGAIGATDHLTGLALRAGTVSLGAATQYVDTLAADLSLGAINFTNGRKLTVGTVDGLSGVKATSVTLGTTGGTSDLIVDSPITATLGNISLASARDAAVNAALTANVGGVGITAGRDAAVAANVTAGAGNYTVSAVNVALGKATANVVQKASAIVDITATTGNITGAGDLDLISNSTGANLLFAGATRLDATGGKIDLGLASSITATGAYVGVRAASGQVIALGDVTGLGLYSYNGGGTYSAVITRTGSLTAGVVTLQDGFIANLTAGDFRAKSVSVSGPSFVNGTQISLNVQGDVTGASLAPATNPANSDPAFGRLDLAAATIGVTAAGLVQLGTVTASQPNLTITAGNYGGTGSNGSIDIATISNLAGDVTLSAYAAAPPNAAHDGDVIVGFVDGGGAVTLDNKTSGGSKGDVVVTDAIRAANTVTLKSADDVLIRAYDGTATAGAGAGAGTGFVRSNSGSISIEAQGSVYGIGGAENDIGTAARGIGSLGSLGDLTITSAGDVRLGSVTAGGNLVLDIAGSLTGLAGGSAPSAPLVGGSLFAEAPAQAVTVKAGLAGLGTTDVITLDKVTADSVTLQADVIGVNALTNRVGTASYTGSYYFGSYTVGTGVTSIPLGDAEGDGITTLALYTADTPGTDTLNAGFGSVNLTAGLSITTAAGHPIGYGAVFPVTSGAQLGTVQAGTTIDIDAPAIVAGQVTSTTAGIDLLATNGTLSLTGANAATNLTLTKQGGLAANIGDELRVGTATAGRSTPVVVAGAINLVSSTHVRTDSSTAQGALQVTASNDVTGTLGGSGTRTDTSYSRGTLSANGGTSDLTVNAGGLVQLATASAGRSIVINAGSAASDGTVDITTAAAGNNLTLQARAIAPLVPASRDGDILLGSGSAGGTAALKNFFAAGDVGDIAIGDRLTAGGAIQIESANDVRLAQYNPAANGGTGSGLLRTLTGPISLSARGSVYTAADNSLGVTARGIDSLTGSALTINASGDARINAIDSSSSLQLNIGGSLTGTSGTGTVTGASLFAEGLAGSINVQAGLGGALATDVAVFDTVSASGSIQITADAIGVNTLSTPAGPVTLTGAHYIGTAAAGSNLSISDAEGNGIDAAPLFTADTVGGVDSLDAGFGRTTIDANGSIATPAAIGGIAQLDDVTAGTSVSLQAKAITGNTVTANNGAISLTASQGTLSLVKADASGNVALTKQGGSFANGGDELRVDNVFAGRPDAGTVSLTSSTHVRGNADALGTVTINAAGDVTGIKGGSGVRTDSAYDRATLTASGATSDVIVTAGGLVQLGTASADRDLTVTAGDATHDGAIDVTAASAGNNLALTATSIAPSAPIDRSGDILIGTGTATAGSVTLANTAGDSGDIVVGDKLVAQTGITVNSTDDVHLTQYNAAGSGTGLLRTATGAIAINADGSVYTTLENALEATRRGIDLLTGNNLTIASAGDVRLDSITVTGNLTFDVAGSLTGRLIGGGGGGGTTTVNGAGLFAQGTGGNVTVRAGLAGLPSTDIISLDQIVASGAVTLAADQIAVRDIQAGGDVNLSGAYYLGTVTIGGGTITLGDGDGDGINAFALFTADEATAPLAAGYGKASIVAGGVVASPSATSIGGIAQLGTVDAAQVNLDAKAITADSVSASSGSVLMTATAGTLSLGTVSSFGGTTLAKQGGLLANAGDELRVGSATLPPASTAGIVLDSSTALRIGSATSRANLIAIARGGDLTGLKGPSTGTSDTGYGRAVLSAPGVIGVTSNGLAQLGAVNAGIDVAVTAGNFAGSGADGAIDIATSTATSGNLLLTATASSPAADAAHDGDILLGTGVAGALARLSNVIAGGNTGLVEVSGGLSAGNTAIVDSAGAVRLAPVTATAGSIAVRARTSVAGYAAGSGVTLTAGPGTSPSAGEDVAVRAGTTALVGTIRADDDISITAGSTLSVLGTLTTTGLGPDTHAAVFTDPTTITFGAETVPGAGITLSGNGVSAAGLVKAAGNVAITGGPSASTAAISATGSVTVGAGVVSTGAITAGGAATMTATSGALTAASVSSGGATSLTAASDLTVAGAIAAGGDVGVTAPGAVSLASIGGANISLTGGTLSTGAITAAGNLDAKSTSGALSLASASAGGAATVASATTASVSGNLAAAGNLTLTAPGAVTLTTVSGRNVSLTGGTVTTGAISATADLAVKSTTGSVTLASASATGNAAVTSASAATVTGALSAGGDLTVTAPGAVQLGTVAGRNVNLSGGTIAAGATTATGNLTATTASGALSLASAAVSGAASLTSATSAAVTGALSAGGDVTVTAPGAIALGTVSGRNVVLTGGTIGAGATTATGNLTATSASGALSLASATATGAASLTSATTASVTGALSAGGDLTVTAPGAVALGTVAGRNVALKGATVGAGATTASGTLTATSTTGALTLASANAAGTATLASATTATVTGALTSNADVTVTAPGAVSLGSLGGRALTVSGSTATIGPVTATGALTVNAATGALTMGAATAGGTVNLTAATKATLAGVAAGTNAITLTAADADITGAVTGGSIKVVDKAAAANTLVLGDGTTETGFNLSQDEVNRLNAPTVTFDAGTALTPQNIRIGTLAIDGDTGSTALNFLSLRRIDITGTLGATGSGGRAITIGGNGTTAADPGNAATVLRVAALGSGGGRLIVPGVNLTLRANAIGVGQDALFLDSLGLNVGGTPLANTLVATDYVGNTFSTLYSSIRGGTAYTDPVLISAGSLTVRYTNFALFQNSGLIAANTGLVLQTSAGTALDVRGLGTTQGGPIALFGSINGITNAAAAVLGEPIITYSTAPSIDRTSARINGCLIGSGSACIGLNINPAQLPALDPIRDQLIDRPEGLEIPFDPLVGTNNESLFGDVGSFGLTDVPLDLVECKKDAQGKCETPAEGAK